MDTSSLPVIASADAPLTMSSREIADLVESRHDKVKQSIERLVQRGTIVQPPMGDVVELQHQPNGGTRERGCAGFWGDPIGGVPRRKGLGRTMSGLWGTRRLARLLRLMKKARRIPSFLSAAYAFSAQARAMLQLVQQVLEKDPRCLGKHFILDDRGRNVLDRHRLCDQGKAPAAPALIDAWPGIILADLCHESADAPLTMSSREIADLVESRHDKVKQSIERLVREALYDFPQWGVW